MIKLKKEEFIEKSIIKHGDKYIYKNVVYVDYTTKVDIICPIHGSFFKKPGHHLRGQGCPICARENKSKLQRNSLDSFIERSNKIHNNKYDYNKVIYKSLKHKVIITCPIHGDFDQTPGNHIKGKGCRYCTNTYKMTTSDFIKKSKLIFGDHYVYDKSVYTSSNEKIIITCPIHGDFVKTPNNHLIKKQGCVKCLDRICDTESFISSSKLKFNSNFTYEKTVYNGMKNFCIVNCKEHGEIKVKPLYHLNSSYGCKKCSNSASSSQNEIVDFIKTFNLDLIENDRSTFGDSEIDIFIPSKKIGIEYNGLYWHSSEFKEKNYHLNKTIKANKNKINLIHIFEDEWVYKKNIVKSIITHKLGVTPEKIYSRKCDIRLVNKKEKRDFLNKNHIQGDCPTNINIGLYFNDELVSLMCFGFRSILKVSDMEMIRFCNKLNTNVIGSFSKLLKNFIKNNEPKKIISYCDKRWGDGGVYLKNGFKLIKDTIPNYFYIINKKRESRYKYQKHKLKSLGFNCIGTEEEIMKNNNYYRIYDCGNKKYELSLDR